MQRLASSDGVTIALHDLGGGGEPVLLCHATGFLGHAYEPMARELRAHAHVWALDFRGHGDSTAPSNDRFDWRAMTDDLEVAVDAITESPIALFGHSMGGATTVLLEKRRPGRVRCAYLFEPIIIPVAASERMASADNPMVVAARRRRAVFASREEAYERYASRPPLNAMRPDALAAYVQHGFADEADGTVRLKCAPEHEAATFAARDKPTLEDLSGIRTRITIGMGRTDEASGPAAFGEGAADALANGVLERHPSLTHFGPMERPDVLADRVRRRLSADR